MIYRKYIKRLFDIVFAFSALVLLCWLYVIIALLVRVNLGRPVFFCQVRPGMKDEKTGVEKLFKLYKFRTMTDSKDKNGNPLPDEDRLTKFGAWLRLTSLDELPQAINILKGEMSVIGPRPQLVRDMVFMTDEQRQRHNVKPGLSGLAQVTGRNAISWEEKLSLDLEYIHNVSFFGDVKIVFLTAIKVLRREDIYKDDMSISWDYGDYLLRTGIVDEAKYQEKQIEALDILKGVLENE